MTTTTAEILREVMEQYNARRANWIEALGTPDGFDEWFTEQIVHPVTTPKEGLYVYSTGTVPAYFLRPLGEAPPQAVLVGTLDETRPVWTLTAPDGTDLGSFSQFIISHNASEFVAREA